MSNKVNANVVAEVEAPVMSAFEERKARMAEKLAQRNAQIALIKVDDLKPAESVGYVACKKAVASFARTQNKAGYLRYAYEFVRSTPECWREGKDGEMICIYSKAFEQAEAYLTGASDQAPSFGMQKALVKLASYVKASGRAPAKDELSSI